MSSDHTIEQATDVAETKSDATASAIHSPAVESDSPGLLTAGALAATALALTACGGGDDNAAATSTTPGGRASAMAAPITATWPTWGTPDTAGAWRLANQATMGATEGIIAQIKSRGYEGWLTDELAKPASAHSHFFQFDSHCGTNSDGTPNLNPTYWSTAAYAQRPDVAPGPLVGKGSIQRTGWLRFLAFSTWTHAYRNTDQLRQRVVHALGQFLVASGKNDVVGFNPQMLSGYIDTLNQHAFGNYRTLIEAVVRSPAMGHYLSHFGNQLPVFDGNVTDPTAPPPILRVPDQNFGRELLQLFTIGLTKLAMDGSEILVNGKAVPTTTRDDIIVLSNVFTGWGYEWRDTTLDADGTTFKLDVPYTFAAYYDPKNYTANPATGLYHVDHFYDGKGAYAETPTGTTAGKTFEFWWMPNHRSRRQAAPMIGYTVFPDPADPYAKAQNPNRVPVRIHSTTLLMAAQLKKATSAVTFLGKPFSLGNTPEESMNKALDIIFAHQNLAPFVAKQMIQHLVTSNPSAAYVQRVATSFKTNNWSMTALIKAILLDNEARLASAATSVTYGRLREPFLRVTALLRGIGITNANGGIYPAETSTISSDALYLNLNNAQFMAPSVFNDFSPTFKYVGGKMAAKGKVSPQMQIATESSVIAYANAVYEIILRGLGQDDDITNNAKSGYLNIDAVVSASPSPSAIVGIINSKLFGGTMSSELKSLTQTAASGTAPIADRFRAALYIAMMSTEFIVQK
jgi:uncharacterized protein (DUF1800 family)